MKENLSLNCMYTYFQKKCSLGKDVSGILRYNISNKCILCLRNTTAMFGSQKMQKKENWEEKWKERKS